MRIINKMISALCAVSMLATMFTAMAVNAEGEKPSINMALKSAQDNTVVISVTMADVDTTTGVKGVKFGITYPSELVANPDEDVVVTFDDVFTGIKTINPKKAYDTKLGAFGSCASSAFMPCTNAVAEVSIKLNKNVAEITDPIEFNIVEGFIQDTNGTYNYDATRNTLDVSGSFKLYPAVEITKIIAADPVYTGKNVNLTAEVDAAKLGDRVISWTATNGEVTPDAEDSTKAVLVPAADGKVTVTATVDNNGTEASMTVEFEAETKPEPKPYTITASAVSNGETTLTIKPDAEYVYGDGEVAPSYKLVAQFYSEGDVANSWVSIDGAALTEGQATFTVGAQNAKTVSVTAYDSQGNVIGQN